MKEQSFDMLTESIFQTLGFNAHQYEIKHLKRRIQTRMNSTKTRDYKEYIDVLHNNAEERERLKSALTVNVTEFFRNPEVYMVFESKILPSTLKDKEENKEKLRIWSLGCSTGKEPYTIAMILAEALERRNSQVKAQIIATDIDKDALKKARSAQYKSIINTPKRYSVKYLEEHSDGQYRIKNTAKNLVTFKKHDIFTDKPLKKIDIIFCRNMIIYFNRESKNQIYKLFNQTLGIGGHLILGKAESFIKHREYGFDVAEKKSHIFRKIREIGE